MILTAVSFLTKGRSVRTKGVCIILKRRQTQRPGDVKKYIIGICFWSFIIFLRIQVVIMDV